MKSLVADLLSKQILRVIILTVAFCGASRAQLTVTDISPDAAFGTVLANGLAPSGRVNGIVVDPTNASILYAATEFVGVWKSVDRGQTWSPSSQGLRSGFTQEIGATVTVNNTAANSTYYNIVGRQVLAIDAANPARLLYATQPVDGRIPFPCTGDPTKQCNFGGLWVSVDAAATWKHVEFPNCQSWSAGLKWPIGFAAPQCKIIHRFDPSIGIEMKV
jgi:hypothetical protein